MGAQILHVEHFEAGVFGFANGLGEVDKLASGEDSAAHEQAAGVILQALRARNGVVEEQTVRREQRGHLAEVLGRAAQPHVLEHAHRGDLIVVAREVAIVQLQDARAALQPRAGEIVLRAADGAASGGSAVPAGRVSQQRAPSAADVQETFAGLNVELPADVVQLGELGFFEGHLRRAEIGAGVDHARVQEQAVKIVRAVVVKPDVTRGLRLALEDALQGGGRAGDHRQQAVAKRAPRLPALQAYGGGQVAFHVELAANKRHGGGIGVCGKKALQRAFRGHAECKSGRAVAGLAHGSIAENGAPGRRGGKDQAGAVAPVAQLASFHGHDGIP